MACFREYHMTGPISGAVTSRLRVSSVCRGSRSHWKAGRGTCMGKPLQSPTQPIDLVSVVDQAVIRARICSAVLAAQLRQHRLSRVGDDVEPSVQATTTGGSSWSNNGIIGAEHSDDGIGGYPGGSPPGTSSRKFVFAPHNSSNRGINDRKRANYLARTGALCAHRP